MLVRFSFNVQRRSFPVLAYSRWQQRGCSFKGTFHCNRKLANVPPCCRLWRKCDDKEYSDSSRGHHEYKKADENSTRHPPSSPKIARLRSFLHSTSL